jgi:hypothetical protein
MAGISLTSVLRLKRVWKDRLTKKFERLRAFVSADKNYRAYRNALARGSRLGVPQIPHLALLLKVLLLTDRQACVSTIYQVS